MLLIIIISCLLTVHTVTSFPLALSENLWFWLVINRLNPLCFCWVVCLRNKMEHFSATHSSTLFRDYQTWCWSIWRHLNYKDIGAPFMHWLLFVCLCGGLQLIVCWSDEYFWDSILRLKCVFFLPCFCSCSCVKLGRNTVSRYTANIYNIIAYDWS